MRPYREKILSENKRIRKFSKDVNVDNLIWHRDANTRVVEVVSGSGWFFQRDDELPFALKEGDVFEIEKESWHRLVKGRTDLSIMITEKKKKKKKKKTLPAQYGAPEGSKRAKLLKKASDLYKKGKIKDAAKIRRDMEAEHMDESILSIEEDALRAMIYDITEEIKLDSFLEELFTEIDAEELMSELFESADHLDEMRKKRKSGTKRRKKRKKSGKSPKGLSKAVKKSLDKKADRRCLTRGSVYSEFRKGLSAFLSSGSRKGMSAHQWAHARVNSAQPSKKWASVKKRKKCPKKKKK